MDEEKCKLCDHLIQVCENLGNGEICKQAVEDFKNDKINSEQFIETVSEHFNMEKFQKEWDRLVDIESESNG